MIFIDGKELMEMARLLPSVLLEIAEDTRVVKKCELGVSQ